MNRDSFSRCAYKDCHCCHRGTECQGSIETPCRLTNQPSSVSDRDLNKSREPCADVFIRPGVYRERLTNHGRRRSESAPDALLDCLHCGKDLDDLRIASSACLRKNHSRRSTVANERVWSPKTAVSPPSRSFSQRHKSWGKQDSFQQACQCSRRRKDVKCRGAIQHSFLDKGCSGDPSTNPEKSLSFDYDEKRPSHSEWTESFAKQITPKRDENGPRDGLKEQPWTCSKGNLSKRQTTAETESEECTGGGVDFLHDRRRSVGFDGSACKSTWDDDDDADNDGTFDEESEAGFVNVNENRRRKSLTSFTELRDKENRERIWANTPKRHSYPGYAKSRHSSPRRRLSLSRSPKKHHHRLKRAHDTIPSCGTAGHRRSVEKGVRPLPATSSEDEAEAVKDWELAERSPARHDSLLMTNLSDMQRRHRLCDVVLRSNGQEVAAHKLALAAFSETFARTYCEGDHGEVVLEIPDTSAGGIQEVLRFVYLGHIRLTPDNVAHVLAAATYLHIEHIVNMCKQMILHPDSETVISFNCLAEKYHLTENLGFYYNYICKHFLRVSRTRAWRTLTFGQIFDLLCEDSISVERELDVFHAAVAWIDADRTNRLTFAADLIGCVRFVYITPDEIAKHVETKQFLFQGDEGKELLLCIYRHHALQTCGCQHGHRSHRLPRRKYVPMAALPPQNQSNSATNPCSQRSIESLVTRHTRTTTSNHVILFVGGVNPFQPDVEAQARLIGQFHPRANRWTPLTRLPDGRHHHGAVVMDGVIYIIGGSVLDDLNPGHLCNPTASCYRYNISSRQWSAIAPLNSPRMYHASTVLNGVIFVVAGQTQRSRHLTTMECYRSEVGEWETGVEMSEGCIGVAVAGYRGLLYAVGGFQETEIEHVVRASVEVFDPSAERWRSLNRLPSPRCHAALVECRDKLYLVGGSTFPAHCSTVCSLASILRYDEIEDRWDRIQTLRTPRHDMGIAVLDKRIFIVGGVSSTENYVLSDVECYDVEGDCWLEDVDPITTPALGLTCLTVTADLFQL